MTRLDLTGVVLCGGRSARMGSDKAALGLHGATLLERAARALEPIAAETLLACGPTRRYAELGLRLCLDARTDGGPLAGLEAGLAAARTPWIAALACDMPRADAAVFAALLERAEDRELDACLLETAEGVEPLCAVYRSTCLAPVRAALDAGERKLVSFWSYRTSSGPTNSRSIPAVGVLPERELPEEIRSARVAVNLNTPGELSAETAAWAADRSSREPRVPRAPRARSA